MDIRLWDSYQQWSARRTHHRQGLHEFPDGALHISLLLAVVAVAVLAAVELASVGAAAWRLETVVIHGKSQQLPLPSQPMPLQPAR
ncbi:hypothetical protein SAMN05216359_101628 [Roseateles sp. YR242]|uniref:hypothetical protein n=1 Tax=Roseateles sp. YR242 TaxID=1855305 RepID=UPI0008BF741B|nr:hypothetical protein [Roseateles sp. YR242]SEK38143.1 hypothetical protein SAMN05216359_101628 [Roseateles sp. YR242]